MTAWVASTGGAGGVYYVKAGGGVYRMEWSKGGGGGGVYWMEWKRGMSQCGRAICMEGGVTASSSTSRHHLGILTHQGSAIVAIRLGTMSLSPTGLNMGKNCVAGYVAGGGGCANYESACISTSHRMTILSRDVFVSRDNIVI